MKKLFQEALNMLEIKLSTQQMDQFFVYKSLLLEWNKKINLTAITEDREVILKHFIDCLTIVKLKDFDNSSIIDVGTGAGFPGLPIKIAVPSTKVTLMDSLNKRIKFLEEVTAALKLEGVDCIHSRAEDAGHNKLYREKFDFCVSRAVANLASLSEYCLPFLKINGEFIAMKGPSVENEIKSAETAIKTLGCEIVDVKDVYIPFTDLNHKIIFIKKFRQTSTKYPRKTVKISKNPIL